MKDNQAKYPQLRFKGFTDPWEERKLGDIVVKAIDNRGKTPPTSENDKYPLLEVASIGGYYPNYSKVTKFVNYNIFNSWFRAHLKKGDILFSTVGNTGLATLMDDNQDATIAQNIVGFRAKNSSVPEFLLQMFKLPSNLKKVKRIEMGAVQPSIKVSQLIEVQYLLPKCKHEQEKIGSFFKQLDKTIALHQRKLAKLKELKQGYLQKLFPKNGSKFPQLRFAGFADAWEQRKLGEYGYFYYGKSAPKWSLSDTATTPCVRYGELYTRHATKIDKIYSYTNIPKENLKFSNGTEVLIPRVGEDPLDFANCSWLSIPNVAIGEMISVFNSEQNPLFIAYYINSTLKYELAKRVEGGNVSNLYFNYLEGIRVRFPLIPEQIQIATLLNKTDQLIASNQRKLEKLQELKKGYLQKMFC
ncbi:restriction endonuclease subunit S [Levilactobacillus brevis]|uniref:restriction endonuclease subunit S n=1 Tax=Levilactobacillus brevis TaxID=1580 RepID=UPI0021A63BC9|nr:restriction endonuclease subunit S [Levilactobacillus brevis]